MRTPPLGSSVTDSAASRDRFGLMDATSKAGGGCAGAVCASTGVHQITPARAMAMALRNGAGGLTGVVGDDDVCAGPADRRQALEHGALFVEPAVACRRFEHRILAADVIRGRRIAELGLHARE